MRLDTIRDAARDPLAVALALGLEVDTRRKQARGVWTRCPWHSPDRSASCSLTLGSDGTARAHCFSCGASGDVFGLVAAVEGLDVRHDFADVARLAAERLGVRVEDDHRPARARAPMPRAVQLAAMLAAPIGSYHARDERLEAFADECSPEERAEALEILRAVEHAREHRDAELDRLAAEYMEHQA